MDTKQKPDAWINNPKLAGMDMSKLAMLTQLAEQGLSLIHISLQKSRSAAKARLL